MTLLVERRVRQAPSPSQKPDVTAPEWVSWFEEGWREFPDPAAATDESAPSAAPATWPRPEPASARPVDVPTPPTARRTPVLAVGIALGALLVAVVVGAGATWWWAGHDDPAPATRALQVGADSSTAVPRPPVEVPVGGRHTQVRVLPDDDLLVQEWVRRESGELVYERYRLVGSLQRSDTRALARLALVEPAPSTERTIAFVGATVLAVACTPPDRSGVPQPCGSDAGALGWRLTGPDATPDAEITVQLDLTG